MSNHLLFLMFIALIGFSACGPEDETTADPANFEAVEGEFTLQYGEIKALGDLYQVRFDEVLEDSRCPINAICGWEGRARVRIHFIEEDAIAVIELTKHEGHPELAIHDTGALKIELVAVNPHPIAGPELVLENYSIVLRI